MINAKDELLRKLSSNKKLKTNIICADITFHNKRDDSYKRISLKMGFDDLQYEQFLNQLEFDYNDESGSICLSGVVWLNDNDYFERTEYEDYDGYYEEYWKYYFIPVIPGDLK